MNLCLMFASMLLSACVGAVAGRDDAGRAAPMSATHDPFPIPKSGITIAGDGTTPLLDVVTDLERVTGVRFVFQPDVRAQLTKMSSGLTQSLEVPASRVYSTVENLLVEHELMLVLLQDEPPVLVGIVGSSPGGRGGGRTPLGQPVDLEILSRHPAFRTSVVLTLPHVNVRDMSNSMRLLTQDAGLMQLIPVGNSDSVLLSGRGAEVASVARLLLAAEESEARRQAAESKRPASSGSVKQDEAPPK